MCGACVLRKFISVLKKVITPRTEYGEQKNEYIGERKDETQEEQEELGVTKRHTLVCSTHFSHRAGHSGRPDAQAPHGNPVLGARVLMLREQGW